MKTRAGADAEARRRFHPAGVKTVLARRFRGFAPTAIHVHPLRGWDSAAPCKSYRLIHVHLRRARRYVHQNKTPKTRDRMPTNTACRPDMGPRVELEGRISSVPTARHPQNMNKNPLSVRTVAIKTFQNAE